MSKVWRRGLVVWLAMVWLMWAIAPSVLALGPSFTSEMWHTTTTSINYTIGFPPQFPSIDGDRVVWKDDLSGNSDIYLYNYALDDGPHQITDDSDGQVWPDISGDIIVWTDNRDGDWNIYMYDIITDTESAVTTDVDTQVQASVSGDYIVWMDDRDGDWNIYMYQISTLTESQITDNVGHQESPVISGNYIVWEDYRDDTGGDIYFYDIANPVPNGSVVNNDPLADQYWPETDGATIVWMDNRVNGGTDYDIYAYDIAGATETRISSSPGLEAFPAVYGDWIVWTDDRNGNWDVYLYDSARSQESAITGLPADQGVARIYHNIVAWGDARAGVDEYADLYIGQFNYDDISPYFDDLPGTTKKLNVDDGQVINSDPFTFQARPYDDETGISAVRFYVNGTLICTATESDRDGVYSCVWDVPPQCQVSNTLQVVAVDNRTNATSLSRAFTLGAIACPRLAETGVGTATNISLGATLLIAGVILYRLPAGTRHEED